MNCTHRDPRPMFAHVPSRVKLAVTELLEAVEYAEQTSGDYWEFATEVGRLTEGCRLTLNDLRWLVRMGFVDHQREITADDGASRAFQRRGQLTFCEQSCFVLTDSGVLFALQSCGAARSTAEVSEARTGLGVQAKHRSVHSFADPIGTARASHPNWDAQRRVLSLAGAIVKRFKWVAENQETVLAAFEEETWPPRIDDPLSPHIDQDPKRRLSDTIKCLNRNQHQRLIRFRGDGTGEGVVWELAASNRSGEPLRH